LAGYSQGAWVLHDALRELEQDDPAAIDTNRIDAMVFIADPEHGFADGTPLGTASQSAAGLITGGIGQYLGVSSSGPIPQDLVPVSYDLCNSQDPVCAPSSIEVQIGTSYEEGLDHAVLSLPFAGASALFDSAQLHTGYKVHLSESPAPPGEYGCLWTDNPGCDSLLTTLASSIATYIVTVPTPTTSAFSFTEAAGAPFTAHLTSTDAGYGNPASSDTWSLVPLLGSLPAGVTLASDGTLTGDGTTPTGTYNFSVDVSNPTASRAATVTITVK
jgi:hypothetical protein